LEFLIMTSNNGPEKNGGQFSRGQGLNAVYFLARAGAATVLPFLRRGAGVEWPGAPGVASLVLLLWVAADTQSVWMWWYFVIWICALVLRRAESYSLLRQGKPIHSHYGGFPEIAAKLFRVSKENHAKRLEIGLVIVVGGVFMCTGLPEAQVVGGFIFSTCFPLALVRGIEMQMNIIKVRRMNDAMIENQVLQEYWRGGRDDY
jgi:hypothetical protein